MLYGLLIIGLIAFYVFGCRLMTRIDRFLSPKKAVESRKSLSFSFDKPRLAWRHFKRHLSKGAEACMRPSYENALSGEVNH